MDAPTSKGRWISYSINSEKGYRKNTHRPQVASHKLLYILVKLENIDNQDVCPFSDVFVLLTFL